MKVIASLFVLVLFGSRFGESIKCYSCTTCKGADCWFNAQALMLNLTGVPERADCNAQLPADAPTVDCPSGVCMEYGEDCDPFNEPPTCDKYLRGCAKDLTGSTIPAGTARCEASGWTCLPDPCPDKVALEFELCSTDNCNNRYQPLPLSQCKSDMPLRTCEQCQIIEGKACSAESDYLFSSCMSTWCANGTELVKLNNGSLYSIQFLKSCGYINLFGASGCKSGTVKFDDASVSLTACVCDKDHCTTQPLQLSSLAPTALNVSGTLEVVSNNLKSKYAGTRTGGSSYKFPKMFGGSLFKRN